MTTTDRTVTDVLTLVPDMDVLEQYVSRNVRGLLDLDFIDHVGRTLKHNILLYGDSGSAKTTVARAYAAREKLPFYRVPLNGMTDVQSMLGKYVPTTDGHFEWVDGPVAVLVRSGGVLVFDEINMPTPRVLAVLYPLLDAMRMLPMSDHKGEVIRAHKDLVIIATMNPDYEGTRPLNFALQNRFACHVEWGYDRVVEEQLVTVCRSLLDAAAMLRNGYIAGDIATPTPTNRLMEFEDFATDPALGLEFAVENFIASYGLDEQASIRQQMELFMSRFRDELTEAEAV